MNSIILFLFALTLDVHTGEVLDKKVSSGPYTTIEACSEAQLKTEIQKPTGDEIVVYSCILFTGKGQTT